MIDKAKRTREVENIAMKDGKEVVEQIEETFYEDEVHEEKVKAWSHTFNLYNFPNNRVAAGQFNIPFSFLLPIDLPTSFEHEWTTESGKCFAKIRYTVKVYFLDYYNKPITRIEKKFYINQLPLDVATLQRDYKESTDNIKSCCCCNRGVITTKAFTEKNGYYCGEEVWMVVECENRTERPITDIFAEFVKVITVNAQGAQKILPETMHGISGGSVQKGNSAIGQNAKRISVSTAMSI